MLYEHPIVSEDEHCFNGEYKENGSWVDQGLVVSRAKPREGQN